MLRVIHSLLLLVWSCWFGGIIALFISVQALFATFPKAQSTTAVEGAPVLFNAFGKFQLVLAALSLILSFLWRVKTKRAIATGIFSLLAAAALGAIVLGAIVVPKMNTLRSAGETTGHTWGMLHGISGSIYIAEAILLLIVGLLIFKGASMHPIGAAKR